MAEYHYVITAQRPVGGGVGMATRSGVLSLDTAATRTEALKTAHRLLCERNGWPLGSGNIVFFCLEPNALG